MISGLLLFFSFGNRDTTLWKWVELAVRNFNPLSANPTKWSNTLKQFVARLQTNCLSVFDHFVKLSLKGLMNEKSEICSFSVKKLTACTRYCFQRYVSIYTAQKIRFSIISRCNQIRSELRIWSHLLKNSLMKNFIFCAVLVLPL